MKFPFDGASDAAPAPRAVFGGVFALMLLDFADRQVLIAAFPQLKAEWGCSDAQLGALSTAVALTIGVLAGPVARLAMRFRRAVALGAMAALWSLATILGAVAVGYASLLLTRVLVGIGQAGFAPVAIIAVAERFPAARRATALAALASASVLGSIIGVVLGGTVSAALGWRSMLCIVGLASLACALLLAWRMDHRIPAGRASSCEPREPRSSSITPTPGHGVAMGWLLVGFACLSLLAGGMAAWLPSYFQRTLGTDVANSAMLAAVFFACSGLGSIAMAWWVERGGVTTDRQRLRMASRAAASTGVLLVAAFTGTGALQAASLLAGGLCLLGHVGLTFAIAVRPGPDGSADPIGLARLVAGQNVAGLALGPLMAGWMSDRLGLVSALQTLSLVAFAGAIAFVVAARRPEGARTAIS